MGLARRQKRYTVCPGGVQAEPSAAAGRKRLTGGRAGVKLGPPVEIVLVKPVSQPVRIASLILYWAVTAWLLYPLIFKIITPATAKEYLYRAAFGVVLLILIFGKTLFDLLFATELSRARNGLNVALLTLYTTIMAGGVIFMLIRILTLYLNKNASTFTGGNVQI